MPEYIPDLDCTSGTYVYLRGWGDSLIHADGGTRKKMIEHHCRPSDWMQGAIGIVYLLDGQGQLDGGWHIVFWQSETEWDRSLAIEFCPYCGLDLGRKIKSCALAAWFKHLLFKLLPRLP